MIQALSVAISNYKLELIAGEKQSTLNEPEQSLHKFLQFSTSKLFVIGVIGRLASQIVGQALPDLFVWRVGAQNFKDNWRSSLVNRWKPIVEALVPLIVLQIEGDMKDVVRSPQELDKLARKVGLQIKSLQSQYDTAMSPIRDVSSV